MHTERSIHGREVKDLITKFFYSGNFLCFHILLQLEGGEKVFFQEFTDYAEYKKSFGALQEARKDGGFIHIPINNLPNIARTSNLA